MEKLRKGDSVEFIYNRKLRQGTVERVWESQQSPRNRVAGFCVDHGDCYKSYRKNGVSFLATQSS